LINSFAVAHDPDGSAFGGGFAYTNNTDGTITRLAFAGPGYSGAVTETVIAAGGAYGDLAAVGPDCSFYVSQWGDTFGANHWDDGSSTNESAVIRISKNDGSCGFASGGTVPEPASLWLMALGFAAWAVSRKLGCMA
jgi:hypothetical protein